jgi:hypothetical protein
MEREEWDNMSGRGWMEAGVAGLCELRLSGRGWVEVEIGGLCELRLSGRRMRASEGVVGLLEELRLRRRIGEREERVVEACE